MTKITTIIFDLGGILTKESGPEIDQELCKYINADLKKFKRAFNKYKRDLTIGSITLETLYKKVLAELSVDTFSSKEITQKHIELYKKYSTERDQDILDLITLLKNNYTVIALTNTEIEIAELNKKNGCFDPFYKTYISTDLKMMKPDAEIYKFVLNDLQIKPNEVILIDDKQENTNTALKLGFNSIQYKEINQLKTDLNKFIDIKI